MDIDSKPLAKRDQSNKVYEIYKLRETSHLKVHPGAPSGIWEVHEDFLIELVNLFPNDKITSIETGCGLSTAVIANLKWKHTCITPNKAEFDRLKVWLKKHKIPTSQLKFIHGESHKTVPRIKSKFDFVLVDGNHGFPHPYIDVF
jgi:protein-L-isoaspartate O-methyltransferase